jgi:hypothetical protein
MSRLLFAFFCKKNRVVKCKINKYIIMVLSENRLLGLSRVIPLGVKLQDDSAEKNTRQRDKSIMEAASSLSAK